ncbi:MAG: electron transporter RnfD [Candidatus Marinimicrobia bacterium CG08_land_8_20_14_0_20_45_22]|nr:MAG: electron transporter RnfD [Candidatus Marinimicrobia bacterium CG08_land_8_20_14_0_20_45_22]
MEEKQNIRAEESGKNAEVKSTPAPTAKVSEKRPFVLSSSPHFKKPGDVRMIMRIVIAALLPAVGFSVYNFGFHSLITIAVSILAATITEEIVNLARKRKMTITDGSAVLTGLLLAMTLPPSLPLSMVVIGSVFAIFIGKQIFGGLGYNIFNPALIGRAFLQAAFPIPMMTWTIPRTIDAISTATPLGSFKFAKILTPYYDLFMGTVGGCIGETSALAILIGGLFLVLVRIADWRIPLSYLGTVVIFSGILWLINPVSFPDPIFHLFAGGLMLGAFFMATDMVTSPITPKGKWIFGIGAGIILVLIRQFGGLPEGVMYSILIMNSVTPLINRFTRPRYFGEIKQ